MRKLEIINKVSSQTGIDKSDVQETVEAVLITIKEALSGPLSLRLQTKMNRLQKASHGCKQWPSEA